MPGLSIDPAVKNIGDPMPAMKPWATWVAATNGTSPMPTYIATDRGPCSAMIAFSRSAISSIAASGVTAAKSAPTRLSGCSRRCGP